MLALWRAFDELARSDDFRRRDLWPAWPNANQPAVDVVEEENQFVMKAEMPGMKPEEVNVSVDGNVLTLKGEHKASEEQNLEGYRRIQRRYGRFERKFTLPQTVDGSKVDASLENGVLTITLPKSRDTTARRVQVKAGELVDKAKRLFGKSAA